MSYYSVKIVDSITVEPVFYGYFKVDSGTITDFWQSSILTGLVFPYTYCLLSTNDSAFPAADNLFNTETLQLTIKGVNIRSLTIQEFYGLSHDNMNFALFGAYYTFYYQGTNFATLQCFFSKISNPQPMSKTPSTNVRSLYSDNSLVFYKPNSLASGGVCTVSNSRYKARKT